MVVIDDLIRFDARGLAIWNARLRSTVMDRRTFLKSSGGAAAATATGTVAANQAIAAPALLAERVDIVTALGSQFQKGYLRDRADRFALQLRSLSDGRINVTFTATDVQTENASGRSDIVAYFGTETEHLSRAPGLGFFSGLPGDIGLKADHFKTWLTSGGGQTYWDSISGEIGYKPFAVGHIGSAPGLWSRTDLVLIEQITGKSLFASGLSARVGERLGFEIVDNARDAHAIEVPTGVTAALADGVVGQSQFWFSNGIAQQGQILSFGLNLSAWERLSASDKALIETCASDAYHQCADENAAHDRMVAPTLLSHHGIQRRQWQDEVQRAISHLSVQVVEEVAVSSNISRGLYENYMFFRQTVTGDAGIGNSVGLV